MADNLEPHQIVKQSANLSPQKDWIHHNLPWWVQKKLFYAIRQNQSGKFIGYTKKDQIFGCNTKYGFAVLGDKNDFVSICNRRFPSFQHFCLHLKKDHFINEKSLVPCDLCQDIFTSQQELSDHKNSECKENQFNCKNADCKKRYKSFQQLSSHASNMHLKVDQPMYKCK